MIRRTVLFTMLLFAVSIGFSQTVHVQSKFQGDYYPQASSRWYNLDTEHNFSVEGQWENWKAKLSLLAKGILQDPSTVNDLSADLGESYIEWKPLGKSITDYDFRIQLGRFAANDPALKLYDTTLDGLTMKLGSKDWTARIEWGYQGFHVRGYDQLSLTQSDLTRQFDSGNFFASPKALASTWVDSQVFGSSHLFVGVSIVRDLRPYIDSSYVISSNDTTYSTTKSGAYDSLYALFGVKSYGDFVFDATGIYQRGETVVYQKDPSVLRYIVIPINAVSIEGRMGPRFVEKSFGLDFLWKYNTGDGRERDSYSESSQTYDRKTSLFKAPQRQEISFAFPISNGNISALGLAANWTSDSMLPNGGLRFENRFQTLFRTETGPIEGYPDVNSSNSKLLGWTNDVDLAWAPATWATVEFQYGLFMPNPYGSIFWQNVKDRWEHRFELKFELSF